MATLHVRNVPPDLYERLRQRAESQRRSLSAEVIVLLERAVAQAEVSPQATLSAIRCRRIFDPAPAGAPDSVQLLRQDRGR